MGNSFGIQPDFRADENDDDPDRAECPDCEGTGYRNGCIGR